MHINRTSFNIGQHKFFDSDTKDTMSCNLPQTKIKLSVDIAVQHLNKTIPIINVNYF